MLSVLYGTGATGASRHKDDREISHIGSKATHAKEGPQMKEKDQGVQGLLNWGG